MTTASIKQLIKALEEKDYRVFYDNFELEARELSPSDFLLVAQTYARAISPKAFPKVQLAILHTFTAEPLQSYLEDFSLLRRIQTHVKFFGYNRVQDEVFNNNSELYKGNYDGIVMLTLLDDLWPEWMSDALHFSSDNVEMYLGKYSSEIFTLVKTLRERTKAHIFINNYFSDYRLFGAFDASLRNGSRYFLEVLNNKITDIAIKIPNVFVLDLASMMENYGTSNLLDIRMKHFARIPFSQKGFLVIAEALSRQIVTLNQKPPKKCIVLDCDNTLWKGIVGEDGIANIGIGPEYPGSCYQQFQRKLLAFYYKGLVLAINSRNDRAQVMEALDSNPHQILKSKYFSSIQANWDDKATNMRRIAEELNLSTDSFVYFDDNPEECELIRQLLPEIKVVQVPDDPLKVEHVLDSVLELERFSFTQEDLARGEQYSANVQRTMLKESVSSLEEYYSSLHTKLTFHVNAEDQVERLSQLCQKTNQFNLTSKRYTDADVAAFMKSDESPIFSVEVEDRFGNSGLVGEAICKKISSDDWEIDTFLMSCRVLGRTIENAFLNFIVEQIASRKAKKIFATFVPTKKNGSVEDFYDKNGFKLLSSTNGTKKYELEYRDYEKQNLPWFTIVVK